MLSLYDTSFLKGKSSTSLATSSTLICYLFITWSHVAQATSSREDDVEPLVFLLPPPNSGVAVVCPHSTLF